MKIKTRVSAGKGSNKRITKAKQIKRKGINKETNEINKSEIKTIANNSNHKEINDKVNKNDSDLMNMVIDNESRKESNGLPNKMLNNEPDNVINGVFNDNYEINNDNIDITNTMTDDDINDDDINLTSNNDFTNNNTNNNDEIDDASDESDLELEETKVINITVCNNKPIESNLTIEARCYLFSRDQLIMRNDNIAHFISKDCKICSEVWQQLVEEGYINLELIKNENLEIGFVVQTELSNGILVYSIIVKEQYDELLKIENVINGLESLRNSMIMKNTRTVSIAF